MTLEDGDSIHENTSKKKAKLSRGSDATLKKQRIDVTPVRNKNTETFREKKKRQGKGLFLPGDRSLKICLTEFHGPVVKVSHNEHQKSDWGEKRY